MRAAPDQKTAWILTHPSLRPMRRMTAIRRVVLRGESFYRSFCFVIFNIESEIPFFRSLDSEEHPETGEPEVKKLKNDE